MNLLRIRVNGEWQELEVRTVADVLRRYGLEDKKVAVEANGTVIERPLWEATPAEDGMVLEIVHFVGGG